MAHLDTSLSVRYDPSLKVTIIRAFDPGMREWQTLEYDTTPNYIVLEKTHGWESGLKYDYILQTHSGPIGVSRTFYNPYRD